MWIFLLSDTFIFSCFLVGYMMVRISTTDPWPNPSEVFALGCIRLPGAIAVDRDHDVHPDYLIRNDGAGGQHGLSQESQSDVLADGRDRRAGCLVCRHAGI